MNDAAQDPGLAARYDKEILLPMCTEVDLVIAKHLHLAAVFLLSNGICTNPSDMPGRLINITATAAINALGSQVIRSMPATTLDGVKLVIEEIFSERLNQMTAHLHLHDHKAGTA